MSEDDDLHARSWQALMSTDPADKCRRAGQLWRDWQDARLSVPVASACAVVAVDDDPTKLNQTIHGVPVKGTLEDIPDLCKRYGIHSIIIAIPTLKGSKLNHVIDLCVSTHCAVQLLSDPQLVGSGTPQQGAFRELNPAQKALMLSARKEAGKFTEGVILSKSMEVLFRAVPPSLYLALAQTEPEEKAERFQLMQQYGIGELDAAFKIAEKIDRARSIEPLVLDALA